MPIGAAAGTPQYSGNYVPTYFSKRMVVELYEATCLKEVTNNNYLDEIKKGGDAVIARTLPDITIRERAKNGEIIIENLDNPPVTVSIDHEKYFSFVIDRVDEFQSDLDLQGRWAEHGGKKMNINIETAIFADIYADASIYNAGLTAGKQTAGYNLGVSGTPFVVTKTNAYDKTVDCNSCLDEQFAEDNGRFIVVPPAMANLYQKGDLKDANVYKDGEPVAKNGWMGTMPLTGMKVYKVNTLTAVTDGAYTCFHVLFGQKEGTCYASQLNELKIGEDVKIRGKVCSGFNDFGYKVVKEELLGDFYCRFVNADD
jgi:hypothetical protein